jgi:hypothetical protein
MLTLRNGYLVENTREKNFHEGVTEGGANFRVTFLAIKYEKKVSRSPRTPYLDLEGTIPTTRPSDAPGPFRQLCYCTRFNPIMHDARRWRCS